MDKNELKLSKLYGVETKTLICIGTYIGYGYNVNDKKYILEDVIQRNNPKNIVSYFICRPRNIKYAIFASTDIVYDLEEIKENGQKARQTMEQRALDKILKKIVDENFEW